MRASAAPVIVLAALVGCAAAPLPPVPRRAEVRVMSAACLPDAEIETRVGQVLAEHRADRSGLVVTAISSPVAAGGAEVELRVVRSNGDVGLDRHYSLAANDCDSAPQLLALSVDRWLTSFPEWAEPAPPAPLPGPPRWVEIELASAINGIVPPLGVDGQLEGFGDLGGRGDRFGISALVRTSLPQRAGTGRFRQTALLLGAIWRHRDGAWETRTEVRGGALRVNGIGFTPNATSWLAWWEVSAFGGRRFSWGAIGIELAVTALRDHAVTRDGLVSQDIPLLRIGLAGTFGLVQR